jgi:Na+/proline symporter
MSTTLALVVFIGYFAVLMLISWLSTRRGTSLSDFFVAGHRAPWPVVAYGMVGTSLSGVTFISVPAAVASTGMGYLQVVFGYLLGYAVIALVLLPLYYRLNLTSIYEYLAQRYGPNGYRAGASFFLISRATGTAVRLYLMATVLQFLVLDQLGIPLWVTAALVIAMIAAYTARGGMSTLVWTDTLQSTALIGAVLLTTWIVASDLHLSNPLGDVLRTVQASPYSTVFHWDWRQPNHLVKELLSGMLICVVMTGLDQAQMQKNLSIRNLREAQLNVGSYALVLVLVNAAILVLGVLLYRYVEVNAITLPAKSDQLYPMLAFGYLGPVVAVLFMLGLTAAAYSSADDALTALTTSISVDLLGIHRLEPTRGQRVRRWVFAGVALGLYLLILVLAALEQGLRTDWNVIAVVLKLATYTYGPLLGLFAFGILTKLRTRDRWLPLLCVAAPLLCFVVELLLPRLFSGFQLGNGPLLLLNGAIVFVGCWALSHRSTTAN